MAMKTTKTLNVSPDLHRVLKINAAQNGWPIGDYCDAVIEIGLKHGEEVNEIMKVSENIAPEASEK
jgi:hypothetical protein